MIFILHGKDTAASYHRLTQVASSYPNFQRTKFNKENSFEDLTLGVFSQDLINTQKLIICENFLHDQKVKTQFLRKIPTDRVIIFWEHAQLTKNSLEKFKTYAKIENFKPKAKIFWFLDSISQRPEKSLAIFNSLDLDEKRNLIWQLAGRILLLILVKLDASLDKVRKITGKNFEDWQWKIITRQAESFNIKTLLLFYRATLKVDFMIKTGATDLSETTLLPLTILKYLQR